MSPKTVPVSAWLGAIVLGAALAAAPGCSTTNSESVVLAPQGTHPAGWATTHGKFAMPDGGPCAQCHGSASDPAASGGIAKVSCFSGPRGAQWCHANGPAFHPPDWLDKASARFHGSAYPGPLPNGKRCDACHTQADPPSFICLDCHFTTTGGQVPPGSTWVHGTVPGHAAFGQLDVLNPVNRVCIRCHEVNNTFGHMPQPFCHNCHSPAPGVHPAGWANPDSHGAAAKRAPGAGTTGFPSCQGCHGTNLDGVGGTAPTCLNTAACHGAGTGWPHSPPPWRITAASPPGARTHTNTDNSVPGNPNVCALCHSGQSPTPPPAGSTPGCFNNTLCHGVVGHAVPYLAHPAAAVATGATCTNCHTIILPRMASTNAPACRECHLAGNPLTTPNCTSCHASQPNGPNGQAPAGNAYPNIAGAHAKHLALNSLGTPVSCDTCHSTLTTSSQNPNVEHYRRANALPGQDAFRVEPGDVIFGAPGAGAFPYPSQNGGAASFDNVIANLACSNVRCHGGSGGALVRPNWRSGTIATLTNTGCRACHKSTTQAPAQYNDVTNNVFTAHTFHAFSQNFDCTTCHSTVALTQSAHFGTLSDPTIPAGAAQATILTTLQWNPTPPITMSSCTTPATGCH